MDTTRWSLASGTESNIGLLEKRPSFPDGEQQFEPTPQGTPSRPLNRWRLTPRRLLLYLALAFSALLLVLSLQSQHVASRVVRLKEAVRAKTSNKSNQDTGVTIVSAFYVVADGKKHSLEDYWYWIGIFLTNVDQPVVFYTSPDLADKIVELRGNKPITVISDYTTAEEMPPLQALGGLAWEQRMNEIDLERGKHVPRVYGPWTAKPWMLQQAKDRNPYHSKYFFWADAGGFRDASAKHHFRGLPDRLDALYRDEIPADTIILGDATFPWPDGLDYVKAVTPTDQMDLRDAHILGGFFGGQAPGLDWWEEETLKMTQLQSGLHRFAAKEQDIWTHTARIFWPKVMVLNMFNNNGQCGYDNWFAYEYWSDSTECWISTWNGPALFREADH